MALELSGGGALIRMPESVTVNCISELHRLFLEALSTQQSIRIDFGQNEELDASAVQLLYRACQEAEASGLTIAVEGTLPEVVKKTFRDLGLDPFRQASQSLGH
jgi:anti-anti-sigma regulatory factor